jgi:hypothetical protein
MMRPLCCVAETTQPHLADSYGPQKGNAMFPRLIRDRLKALEAQIMPPPQSRVFVFYGDDEPSRLDPPLAEQIAAFKAENSVGQHDHLVVVTFA